jgi:hypothetical protein
VSHYNRRAFVGASAAALSAAALPSPLHAAAHCVTGVLPGFQPSMLTVDCASRHNFRTFRNYPNALGLAGVVSMSFVTGSRGSYTAGNLFLFPWYKNQSQNLPAALPLNAGQYVSATPIPDATLPLDEYFVRFVIKAPSTSFIGFLVDNPYSASQAPRDWCSNVDKLADGRGVGIDWTSHNLNGPWFGGSNWIPGTDTCGGTAWRNLIAAGLSQASVAAC